MYYYLSLQNDIPNFPLQLLSKICALYADVTVENQQIE